MFVLAGHATRVDSKIYEFPTVILLEVLQQQKQDFYYLRHSIDGQFFSQLLVYRSGKLIREYTLPSFPYVSLLRYFSEMVLNFVIVIFFWIQRKKITYIGIDPLNALVGVLLKKCYLVKTTVYYAVDYSTTRFANRVLNRCYLAIDHWVARGVDVIWNVSVRIQKVHAQQGVPDEQNILVPNVPPKIATLVTQRKQPHSLVMVGIIDRQLDFKNVLMAVKMLKKDFPDIQLNIVGNGPLFKKLQMHIKKSHLDGQVTLWGYLPHAQTLEVIAKSSIGLAPYTGTWSFNYYGDSMKCREYAQYGLPIVTTDTHSTVEDIRKYSAGKIVMADASEYVRAMKTIWQSYSTYASNTKRLAKKYHEIHAGLLKTL